MQRLADSGVNGVTLAVKYMSEVFMLRYGEQKHGLKISYSKEKKPMRTGGAIKYAENLIGHGEPFFVLNGDIFSTIDFKALLEQHKKNKAVATIALYTVEDPRRYGTVKLTKNNQITQFVEKAPKEQAPSNFINAGIYVLEPEIFDYIPAGRPVSIEHEVFPVLAMEGKLFGYKFEDIWIDIGKPDDYLKANRMMLDVQQKKRLIAADAAIKEGVKLVDPVCVDSGVSIGKNSQVGPYTVVGNGVEVGANVCLTDSVVFPDAVISDGASVTGAVIGEGTIIGEGTKIMQGCVIGDYVNVHDNVTISRDVTVCHSKEVTKDVLDSERII
jgi:mannose-1-phosphate guanylyltransferase